MEINVNELFGGPGGRLGWQNIGASRKDVSSETKIDGSQLTRVKAGKEGFGPDAAKKFAKIADVEPVNLYVASQVRSAKMRREAGEIDDATTARIVGKILGGLKEFPGAQVDEDVARALTELAAEASEGATSANKGANPKSTYEALGRDASGLPLKKRGEASATKEKAVPGRLGRNFDGTARKRAM